MTHLWTALVGGVVPGMRLEAHDVLFALGETIEDCLPALREGWRGDPGKLHLDAWGRLDAADGHAIALRREPPGGPRLWFVHTGGYDPARFAELHDNHFVVAGSRDEAKARAVERAEGWLLPHKDAVFDVDAVEDLTSATGRGLYAVPTPSSGAEFRFTTDYRPIR